MTIEVVQRPEFTEASPVGLLLLMPSSGQCLFCPLSPDIPFGHDYPPASFRSAIGVDRSICRPVRFIPFKDSRRCLLPNRNCSNSAASC